MLLARGQLKVNGVVEMSFMPPKPIIFNPFTPKSDKFEISQAAPPEITSHGVKNLAFS